MRPALLLLAAAACVSTGGAASSRDAATTGGAIVAINSTVTVAGQPVCPPAYQEIARALNAFGFSAQLIVEYIENGWTQEKSLVPLINEYNDAITKLMNNEDAYSWLVRKCWREENVADYMKIVATAKEFDKASHSLNGEFEQVNISKTKQKIDSDQARQALARMHPALSSFQQLSKAFLGSSSSASEPCPR